MKFQLVRDGLGRTVEWEFPTKRGALTQLGYCLVDNGYATKKEAQEFAATVVEGRPSTFGPLTFTLRKL